MPINWCSFILLLLIRYKLTVSLSPVCWGGVTDLRKCCLGPILRGLIILEEAREGRRVQQNKFNLQGCVLKAILCCSAQPLTALSDASWNQTYIENIHFWDDILVYRSHKEISSENTRKLQKYPFIFAGLVKDCFVFCFFYIYTLQQEKSTN